MRCVKHVDRNLRKALKRLQSIRCFAKDERETLQRDFGELGINWVIDRVLNGERVSGLMSAHVGKSPSEWAHE